MTEVEQTFFSFEKLITHTIAGQNETLARALPQEVSLEKKFLLEMFPLDIRDDIYKVTVCVIHLSHTS